MTLQSGPPCPSFRRRASGLIALLILALALPGCSWFRGGDGDMLDEQPPVEYLPEERPVADDAATLPRPTDAPRPAERPTSIRPASEVLDVVYFDYDDDTLRTDQVARIDKNFRYLRDNPQQKVIVEGHCDERGTTEYNFNLGMRRANRVRDYFVRNGIAPGRIQVLSKGEEEPVSGGHEESAWRLNRRCEFKFFN